MGELMVTCKNCGRMFVVKVKLPLDSEKLSVTCPFCGTSKTIHNDDLFTIR